MRMISCPEFDSTNLLKLYQEVIQGEDTLSLIIYLVKIEERPWAQSKLHECLIIILNLSTIQRLTREEALFLKNSIKLKSETKMELQKALNKNIYYHALVQNDPQDPSSQKQGFYNLVKKETIQEIKDSQDFEPVIQYLNQMSLTFFQEKLDFEKLGECAYVCEIYMGTTHVLDSFPLSLVASLIHNFILLLAQGKLDFRHIDVVPIQTKEEFTSQELQKSVNNILVTIFRCNFLDTSLLVVLHVMDLCLEYEQTHKETEVFQALIKYKGIVSRLLEKFDVENAKTSGQDE